MRRLVGLALAFVVWWTTSPPAFAADEVGVSLDGTSWTSTMTEPLFDPTVLWVPGDERTESFLARNQSNDPALLSIEVVSEEIVSLIETGDLTLSVRDPDGDWTDVSSPGTRQVVSDAAAAPGDTVEIQVSMAFDAASTSESQNLGYDFHFIVSLVQDESIVAGGDVSGDATGGGSGGSDLAITGSDLPLTLTLAGSFLITLGALAWQRSRRRTADG